MRRTRFRLRTLLIAVAVAAVVLGGVEMQRRRERFRALATYHASRNAPRYLCFSCGGFGRELLWDEEMQRKYERAAARPWLAVPPDPAGLTERVGPDSESLPLPDPPPDSPFGRDRPVGR